MRDYSGDSDASISELLTNPRAQTCCTVYTQIPQLVLIKLVCI